MTGVVIKPLAEFDVVIRALGATGCGGRGEQSEVIRAHVVDDVTPEQRRSIDVEERVQRCCAT